MKNSAALVELGSLLNECKIDIPKLIQDIKIVQSRELVRTGRATVILKVCQKFSSSQALSRSNIDFDETVVDDENGTCPPLG